AAAMGLAMMSGVLLGVWAAVRRGRLIDRLVAVSAIGAIAVPSYVVGLGLVLVFAVFIGWLPALGAGEPGDWRDELLHLILPSVALSIGWVGYLARLMRASLLEVLSKPYITVHRAFALPPRLVFFKYALENAALPVLAVLGVGIGRMAGNAVLIEIIFARPGIGKLLYDAMAVRDFPVVEGAVLVLVGFFLLATLATDLLQGVIDPRQMAYEENG
ncbi:MAG TPA: ABC transporter permease, partial [Stellaceae bacterium]|nr:ABC transporter permease [Stellaceae bacterium]